MTPLEGRVHTDTRTLDTTTWARSHFPATTDAVGVCSESVHLVISVPLAMKGRNKEDERERRREEQ